MVCIHAAKKAFHEEVHFKWTQKEEESGVRGGRCGVSDREGKSEGRMV